MLIHSPLPLMYLHPVGYAGPRPRSVSKHFRSGQ